MKSFRTIARQLYQVSIDQTSFADFMKWCADEIQSAFLEQLHNQVMTESDCKKVAAFYMTYCEITPFNMPGVLLSTARQFNCTLPAVAGLLTETYYQPRGTIQ